MPRLTAEAVRTAAGYLAEAVTSGNTLAPFPPELAPTTAAQARRLAAALSGELGLATVGVRLVSAPAEFAGDKAAAQKVAGPVFAPRLLHAPVAPPPLHRPVATVALVAQLAKPLPARARAWTAREVAARLASLHPAIDVSASRYTQGPADLPCFMADLAGLGAVILGRPARAGWQEALATPRATKATTEDGASAWQGSIDVAAALVEVAEAARAVGDLPAGAVLVAASLSPPLPEGGGTLSITGLGKVAVLAAA
jgi:2-keto-4-pentenoate hydratase